MWRKQLLIKIDAFRTCEREGRRIFAWKISHVGSDSKLSVVGGVWRLCDWRRRWNTRGV